MLKVVGSVAYAVALAAASDKPNRHDELWSDFKAKWGPHDDDRFEIFKKNVDFIEAENAKNRTYTLAINKFTALSNEEFGKIYASAGAPRVNLTSDKRFTGIDNQTTSPIDNLADIPDSVDWHQLGFVSSVKDQGDCGSCWAFSTTGAIESAFAIATKKAPVDIAPQQFLDCDSGVLHRGCGGAVSIGGLATAFHWAEDHGMCSWASYPYKEKQGTCAEQSCQVAIPKGAVTNANFIAFLPGAEKKLELIASQQPVSVTLDASGDLVQSYDGGVITGSCGQTPDHAVLVVGYGHDEKQDVDYWKIKNSWGADWGEQGFFRIMRRKPWAPAGECGILENAAYPTVKAMVASEGIVV